MFNWTQHQVFYWQAAARPYLLVSDGQTFVSTLLMLPGIQFNGFNRTKLAEPAGIWWEVLQLEMDISKLIVTGHEVQTQERTQCKDAWHGENIFSGKQIPHIIMSLSGPYLICHLVSRAAHKHLVIILPGSPVISEHTECTTHGDARRPSSVTGCHWPLQLHLPPIQTQAPFSLRPSGCVTVQWKVRGNLRQTVTEAKKEPDLSNSQTRSAATQTHLTQQEMALKKPELPLSERVSVCLSQLGTDRRVDRQTGSSEGLGSIFNLTATLTTPQQRHSACSRKDNTADHCCALASSCSHLSSEQTSAKEMIACATVC